MTILFEVGERVIYTDPDIGVRVEAVVDQVYQATHCVCIHFMMGRTRVTRYVAPTALAKVET